MTKVRLVGATFEGQVPVKVRLVEATFEGTAAAVPPKVRLVGMTFEAVAAVIVVPPAGRPIGPGEAVTLTASLLGGGTADSWAWRRKSGPAIGPLSGTGASRIVVGPSIMPPGYAGAPASPNLVLGITATVGGIPSPEVDVVLPVLPQGAWVWDGAAFVGRRVVPAPV